MVNILAPVLLVPILVRRLLPAAAPTESSFIEVVVPAIITRFSVATVPTLDAATNTPTFPPEIFVLEIRSWICDEPHRTYFPIFVDVKPTTHKACHGLAISQVVEKADIVAIRELLLDL
jgi:hypothetical protein